MGDAQASADEANMNLDMQAFYIAFLNKIRDDQLRYDGNHQNDTGAVADVVPFDGIGGNPGCPVWQVAYIVLARQAWKHYGEGIIPSLKLHYAGLTELVDWFDRHADPKDGLLVTHCYGDWMGFDPESGNGGASKFTPPPLITAFYHTLAQQYMGEIATVLGKAADAAKYKATHTKLVSAWHTRFYDPEAGGYAPCKELTKVGVCHGTSAHGSQTSNSLGLSMGAPPDEATAKLIARNLAEDVMAFGNKTTTGVVGIAFFLPMLDKYGYGDVALSTLLNDDYPSLGHMAHQNMTTLCENWACTFHEAGGGSQNHIMLGGWDTWLLQSVGGLDSAVNGTTGGWRHVVVRVAPGVIAELKSVSFSKRTPYGDVTLSWAYADGKLTMKLGLPVGTTAEVHTPAAMSGAAVTALAETSATPTTLWSADGAAALESGGGVGGVGASADGTVVAHVGAGRYVFEAKY